MSGNHKDIEGPCDLDLWSSDPKINRGHLLDITNQYVKNKYFVINSFQDNQQNHSDIYGPCDLDFWPSDQKINRCHFLVITNQYM
jgi:hypothetical protein